MEVVIIGSSAASKSTADTLLKYGDKDIRVTVISRDRMYYYSRVLLPNFIAGEINEECLTFVDEGFFNDERLRIIKGNATSIDIDLKRVITEECGYKSYDKLVVATGSSAKMPYGEAAGIEGICCLRNLEDALAIREFAGSSKTCVVIGGGLVSMKAAWALNSLGKKVIVLVESNRVLNKTQDPYCSALIKDIFEKQGVNIRLSTGVEGFCNKENRVSGVILKDGSIIDCELVIVGKGVRPNIDLAKDTKIDTDAGIMVDDYMRTTVPDVYAAGDVTQSGSILSDKKELFTIWPDAVEQGKIAACHILGMDRKYQGGISMNSVKFYGVPFITIGDINVDKRKDCTVYTRSDPTNNIYRKIVIRDDRLIGAVFAGDVRYAGMVYWDIRSGREVDSPQKYLTVEGLESLYIMRNRQI